jgi:hypothetical protein
VSAKIANGVSGESVYAAVFEKGMQAVVFYTNTSGEITGFLRL